MFLSVVVPVYKEESSISQFLTKIDSVLLNVECEYEIIFALDPSPDNTELVIMQERAKNERVKLIKFSRRFGQPMATIGGLSYASGDAIIVMDVDMQDPPELIPQMIALWRQGYDVVLPQRVNREGETFIKKIIAAIGYYIISKISEVSIPRNTGDFRLISRRALNEILKP